jgi:predicted ATPase
MDKLTKLTLRGFKSIRELKDFEFRHLNVLIGANGAGKSNFISFFKMLNWMTPSPGNLQYIIGHWGGANSLLFLGAGVTPQIEVHMTFGSEIGINEYCMRLFYAALDTLIFADEKYRYSRIGPGTAPWKSLESGHRESRMISLAETGDKTARVILAILRNCAAYQFHNTSETARIRQRWPVEANEFLKEDGANLAPFLFRMQNSFPKHYSRILETIREIVPFFGDFVLEPDNGSTYLRWRERGTDMVFGAHQASDGNLRMMSLVTLLLQPEELMPSVLIIDEPELGLHPFAINIIAGLIKSCSKKSQVILATQSMTFIDYFEPEDIIVVERSGLESQFKRLDPDRLKEWQAQYSLAELWEKNVIGGRP